MLGFGRLLRVFGVTGFVLAGLAVLVGGLIPFFQSAEAEQRGMSIGIGLVYAVLFAGPGALAFGAGTMVVHRARQRR